MDLWDSRVKLVNTNIERAAYKYVEAFQKRYKQKLEVDLHPTDGWVVFYQNQEETNED
ncbi:hypothetical protein [Priestia megaterium]|uniref:hypothetical protein n=1 Tax=Priestia megaterium TaxID=1404 RepID=UPI001596A663|nr:hypothetical protein [Priestia megaterium]